MSIFQILYHSEISKKNGKDIDFMLRLYMSIFQILYHSEISKCVFYVKIQVSESI